MSTHVGQHDEHCGYHILGGRDLTDRGNTKDQCESHLEAKAKLTRKNLL